MKMKFNKEQCNAVRELVSAIVANFDQGLGLDVSIHVSSTSINIVGMDEEVEIWYLGNGADPVVYCKQGYDFTLDSFASVEEVIAFIEKSRAFADQIIATEID
jgi:hypothetical protein